jgi:D-alanyl-D-alanine endopeptidase (penicillin-binding protein 7)
MHELLFPLLLNSSNVAAEALASTTNRSHFLELMSGYAWEVGMPSTYFADPSGLDPRNAASARDFFALAQYLYSSRPEILSITRTPYVAVATTTDHGAHEFKSIHPFVTDPRFIGGKTGRTPQAGDTMLTIMNIENKPIAIIVLGSHYDGRAADTRILISRVEQLFAKR